jgi:small subunit ribosomal protein S5
MEVEKKYSNNLEKEKVVVKEEKKLSNGREVGEEIKTPEIGNQKVLKNENNSNWVTNQKSTEREKRKQYSRSHLQKTIIQTWRPVKVTKGGRRFSFTTLALIKDEEKKAIAYAHMGGKETMKASSKAFRRAQKKLLTYFSTSPRTITHDIVVNYNATRLILKPTPPGSGIKASEMLSIMFKYLEIKDISVKIVGARNKLNVIRAAFLALDKLTGKKYDY